MCLILCDMHMEQGIFLIDTTALQRKGVYCATIWPSFFNAFYHQEPTSAVLLENDCLMVPRETHGEQQQTFFPATIL